MIFYSLEDVKQATELKIIQKNPYISDRSMWNKIFSLDNAKGGPPGTLQDAANYTDFYI